ncbi:hypothetical protein AMTR_s00012p00253570 [Amborella trichopoda]|uniref:non-specific serine/threonine protein kinase n=2 Tax=Amborella trichopoda TaxID=13333 RepID=W1PDH2_AMBTC|nr:hypothetical protein AMTR_s00012p00253570 [Amborella trichopoda]
MSLQALFLSLLVIDLNFSVSNAFNYSNFNGANMTLSGSEITSSGALQLTNNSLRVIGHAFHPIPLQFKNSSEGSVFSFSTSFVFAISLPNPEPASGFAFVISRSTQLQGAMFAQFLGLFNATSNGDPNNHIFAVEFDTIQNIEFLDINNNHVGIDLNSLRSNASAPAGYYTPDGQNTNRQNLSLKSGDPIQVWIDYNGTEQLLNVTLSPLGVSGRNSRPLLSYRVDLSSIFQEFMYVGFSGSTGMLASCHFILGWSFEVNNRAQDLDLSRLPWYPRVISSSSSRLSMGAKIGISLAAVFLALSAIAFTVYIVRYRTEKKKVEEWELEYGPQKFTYKELYTATKGFKAERLIGCGGFGEVYRGVLPNSDLEVAVKRVQHESEQRLREFLSEIQSIGRLRHRNLVQLYGWCRKNCQLLLVYDYMRNGSLDKYLFDKKAPVLSWEQRFNIVRGVASGLLYLHEEWDQVVIHRDVKASNVLLDADMNGRLGDFGLARLYEHGSDPYTSHVVGTLGYLAPELARTGKPTTESDIFSYGAVLLEVVCGRRPIEPQGSPGEAVLVDWVWKLFIDGRILEVIDLRLGDCYIENEVLMVLKLGLLCSHPIPGSRPTMRQIVQYLDGGVEFPDLSVDDMLVSNTEIEEYVRTYMSLNDGYGTTSSIMPISGLSGGR